MCKLGRKIVKSQLHRLMVTAEITGSPSTMSLQSLPDLEVIYGPQTEVLACFRLSGLQSPPALNLSHVFALGAIAFAAMSLNCGCFSRQPAPIRGFWIIPDVLGPTMICITSTYECLIRPLLYVPIYIPHSSH